MSKYRIQVPEAVTSLVVMLHRLGLNPGPVKAAHIEEKRDETYVLVWFTTYRFGLVKASAKMVAGGPGAGDEMCRRAYLNLRVTKTGESKWTDISDADFEAADLEPSWKYAGLVGISFEFHASSGEIQWSSAPDLPYTFLYYAFKPGDKNRAEKEAEAAAQKMYQEWKLAVESNVSD